MIFDGILPIQKSQFGSGILSFRLILQKRNSSGRSGKEAFEAPQRRPHDPPQARLTMVDDLLSHETSIQLSRSTHQRMTSFREYRRRCVVPVAGLALAVYYVFAFVPLSRRAHNLDLPLEKEW